MHNDAPTSPAAPEGSRALLRAAGLRATAPRQAVLELLLGAARPLSHHEVVELLGTTDWDQATLYRNLVKLVEVGIARIASEVGGVRRYEALVQGAHGPSAHPHFVCTDCGTVTCLPGVRLVHEGPQGTPASLQQRQLEVQVHGRCDDCAEAPP